MLSVPLVDGITVSDFIFLGPEGKSWCIHKEVEGCASVTFHIRWSRVLQLGFQVLEAPLLMHTVSMNAPYILTIYKVRIHWLQHSQETEAVV